MNVISKVAEDNNIQVIFVNNTETLGYGEKNGFRTPEGKIVLALNNQGGLMTAYFGHELCHDLEGTNAYSALESEVMKYLAKTYGDENLQKRIDGIMQSQNLSEQSAKAEIVANSCMTVFDEKFITNFAKTHTKEARTIKDWFNRLVARIRQAMDKVKKYVTEYRAISDDVAEVERIRDLFNAALGERNANVKQDNAKETVTKLNKSNVQYSNKNVVKKTKTRYNEYNTQAMIWSNSNKTKIGDVKIMYKPKVGYTLIECTKQDEGFIELITGKYKEIKRLEQLYSEQITGFNGNVDKFGDFKDGHNWNLQFDSVRKSGKSNSEVSNEQSERNTTNNSEKLHYDNQGKSVKFSVKQPIEETKDLIAIHNTTEKKLLSALELGGLPSPSIAIMKAENTRGNDDFGDISLVFDKSTVDPQADTAEPRVIEAYLNIENPVIIDDGGTFFDYDEGYDFETEEYTDEPRGLLIDFAEALQENLEEYAWNGNVDVNFIFEDAYDGGLYAKELVDKIKRNENFLDYYDEDGNLVINEANRQAFA